MSKENPDLEPEVPDEAEPKSSAFASSLSRLGGWMFTGWEVREKILRPVMVNLLTALLIFLTAVIFKDRIYDFFAPRREAKEWPIYCVVEPEASAGGPVTADLFVVNVGNKDFVRSELEGLAREQSPENGPQLSPLIEVAVKEGLEGKAITDVQPDPDFNKEKGVASVDRHDQQHWRIQLEQIKKGVMLKFIIRTNEERPVSSRANIATLPIKLTYARSN